MDAHPHPGRDGLAALTLAALGVVYGDIGTSPLYTVKEIFAPATGVPLDAPHLVGAISTIVWALMLVVTLKYVLLVLRADNRGEGGVLALAALASESAAPRRRALWVALGVFGATLFYGDSLITPAISVVGAMEGLQIIAPALAEWTVPAAAAILFTLFAVQRHGTAKVGRAFGPVIVLWFGTLAAVGVWHVVQQPAILQALDPRQAWWFGTTRGWGLFATVGAVVLAVTGAEALYADMGHFGRRPIQLAWTGLVLPALALNYLGQGALLLGDPGALENPFYRLFPAALLLPALVLATLAAIIASQAVISGAYSVTRQAIALGWLPRMAVRFTSAREAGQIYMPGVNVLLLLGVLAVVLGFRSSSALAGAYGIAVTLTMVVTSVLLLAVMRTRWGWPRPVVAALGVALLAMDALLAAACLAKLPDGGWFPLALGAALFALMATWHRGRALLLQALQRDGLPLAEFVATLDRAGLQRATRTAVYPVADPDRVPQALLHNLKHNQVLHARNVVVSVRTEPRPWVPAAERVQVEALAPDFWRAVVRCGFMEQPDLPAWLAAEPALGLVSFETTWFLSRQTVVPTPGPGMAGWRERLFARMARNAGGAARHFRLPDNAVVELGTRVQI